MHIKEYCFDKWYSRLATVNQNKYWDYFKDNTKIDESNNIFMYFDNTKMIIKGELAGKYLNPTAEIKDVTIEQTSELIDGNLLFKQCLIIITNDDTPFLLAEWIPQNSYGSKEMELVTRVCEYQDLKKGNFFHNTIIYTYVNNQLQSYQILDILTRKIRNHHGHFHGINERLIYETIFANVIQSTRKKLNKYLQMREENLPDIYEQTSNQCVKLYYKRNEDYTDYELIEFCPNNYLKEDEDIIDLEVKSKIVDNKEIISFLITTKKGKRLKKYLFAQKFMLGEYCYNIDKEQAKIEFYNYWNQFKSPPKENFFDITAFAILVKNNQQIKQLIQLIRQKCEKMLIVKPESPTKDKYRIQKLGELMIDILIEIFTKGMEYYEKDSEISKEEKDKLEKKQKEQCLQNLIEEQRLYQEREEKIKNSRLLKLEEEIKNTIEKLNILYQMKEQINSKLYQEKRIIVQEEQLFISVDDHLEINPVYANCLQYIDLSCVTFDNVKVSGYDFSNTNAHNLNPQMVYQKDMSNGNYEGINFEWRDFSGVNISNSYFTQGFFSYKFKNAIANQDFSVNKRKIKKLENISSQK